MITSMTGYGYAERGDDRYDIAVELKSVNNKYLNVKINAPECLSDREHDIEKRLRETLSRGTVNVFVKFKVHLDEPQYRFNRSVISGYLKDIESLRQHFPDFEHPTLTHVMGLPNVLEDAGEDRDGDDYFAQVEPVLSEAMEKFTRMRQAEGLHLERQIRAIHADLTTRLKAVEERAPRVVEEYREKLTKRITQLLGGTNVTLQDDDLIREVAVFGDRADISEEITRLRAHLDQMLKTLDGEESKGRKLEFLTQEMLREANTIGSKANDLAIAREVVNIKTGIEQLKEQVFNIE